VSSLTAVLILDVGKDGAKDLKFDVTSAKK
jgi:hypothetical protein